MGNKQTKRKKKQADAILTLIYKHVHPNTWKNFDLVTDLNQFEGIPEFILVGHCGEFSWKEMGIFYGPSGNFLALESPLGFFRELCIEPSSHLERALPETNKSSHVHLSQCLALAIMGVCCFSSIASLEERHSLLSELSDLNTKSVDILRNNVKSSVFADIVSAEVMSILEEFLGCWQPNALKGGVFMLEI